MKIEIVNEDLTDYVNYEQTKKNEAGGNQTKRDQRQREGTHEVRKKN